MTQKMISELKLKVWIGDVIVSCQRSHANATTETVASSSLGVIAILNRLSCDLEYGSFDTDTPQEVK